ncbi:PREDICTED: uncharacterized protein LOC109218950 [Nicotiana attenuata]|nr:PREDICTED: uncharacterized protein LOC109218950 [Nicotiana attenuata]
MEKEEKNEETEVLCLQWGSRKRLRCVRVRGPQPCRFRRKISSSHFAATKDTLFPLTPPRLTRNSDSAMHRSEGRKSCSPEKEERCYTTRGSAEENGKILVDSAAVSGGENNIVWPKLYISLSSKEKEEDFMAMKGCKLPQRPKKRTKLIQRTLLLVSPGAWLTDMSLERYEVREKKTSKKKPRGLKAMGSVESDSE